MYIFIAQYLGREKKTCFVVEFDVIISDGGQFIIHLYGSETVFQQLSKLQIDKC